MKKFLYAVILSALVFAGCSDDDKDLIKEQEEEISALKADLEALKKANGDLEKISASLEEEKNRLEEEKTRLEEEKNSLGEENNRLEGEKTRLEGEKNSLEEEKNRLEEEKNRLEGEKNSLEGENNRLEEEKNRLEEEKTQLEEEKNRLEEEKNRLEEEKNNLQTENAELESQLGVLNSRIEQLEKQLETLNSRIEQLENTLQTENAELESQLGALNSRIDQLEKQLETLNSRIEQLENTLQTGNAELESLLNSRIEQLENRLEDCEKSIEELKGYKSKLETLLGGASEEDYAGLVEKVLDGLETLANVKALCAGDYGESTIKEYIDKALGNLESSLGNYVLQTVFNQFKEEYTTFMEGYETFRDSMTAFKDNMPDYATTEEVKALFAKENEDFKNGVVDVVKEALEQGELSDELRKAVEELGNTYAAKIDDLITRVEKLEAQVAGLLGRIQSLVYVPKTSDGKIHIGTSYVSAIDETTGAETKIELTTTKKLEYRVSPASLRDYLLQYQDEVTFSFYQAHVSREGAKTASLPQGLRLVQPGSATRAEAREGHDGLNEFNVVKVEAGNEDGTLLITVDNEHDFTHEDLAVALCIKQDNKETGVLTEYTSAYTTVIGEGSNLISRFYLAKKEDDGTYSKVSRTDRIDYTLVYDDTTPVEFMKGYEVVYDNGETVMPLEEAKEKYEWDSELTGTIKRGGKEFLGTWTSGYTITPQDYQTNKQAPLTFQIKSESAKPDIIGKSWGCNYTVEISDGVDSVPIIPEFNAYVMILPKEYVVEAGITWNSGKWYGGKSRGWHSDGAAYTSSKAVVKYKVDGAADATASTLPSHIKQEIFSDKNPWTVSDYVSGDFLIDKTLEVTVATNIQDLAFTVKGYQYNKGTHTAKISRSDSKGIPTSGEKTIKVTGTLTFEGPADKDLQVAIGSTEKPVVMSTKPEDYKGYGNGSSYALIYMQTTATFIPEDKVLPLDKKFFTDGVSMLVYATVKVDDVSCTKSEGGDESAPETLKLTYNDQPGGRPSPLTRSVNVVDDNEKKIASIQKETTYTFEKGFDIVINEGPTIKVTNGTFKFVPALAE